MAFLPPGCQFSPSEKLLVGYYLANKNNNEVGDYNGANLIKELNLYDHYPFELPDAACFSYRGRERHWYCFTGRVVEEKRKAKSGFWLRNGEVHNIYGGAGNLVLGTRTRFIFYLGNSPKNATRTDWIMYEYALANNPLAPFVLCRIFESSSEICSDISSSVIEAIAWDDGKNGVSRHPLKCASEQDDRRAVIAPCYVDSQALNTQQERLSRLPDNGAFFIEAMTLEQRSLCIQNEDFIQLDDLP